MQSSAARPAASSPVAAAPSGGGKKAWKTNPMWLRIVWLVLLFGATALVVSLVALLYFGGPKEVNYVDSAKEQAVFLTNGQVYFGKIKTINRQYIDLRAIYYLNVNQQVQPNQSSSAANQSVTLVKLGCELHGPTDEMLINRDQVTFWENLKTDGQVTQAISKWIDQNPNGQTCSQSSSSNSSSGSSSNSTTNTTTTKP